jgi:hypothetical protein
MENTLMESELENFLSKKALRLLGMYLCTQGAPILEKKDTLLIRAIQTIFWKALKPTFNRVYIHTSRGGQRLQTKMNHWMSKSLISLDNLKHIQKTPYQNQPSIELSAINQIIKPFAPRNVKETANSQVSLMKSTEKLGGVTTNGKAFGDQSLRLMSEMLNKTGKLNTLRILLSQLEKQIPVNSAYEYNRKKIESSNVKRLFWRQSKRTIDRLSKHLQKNKKFGAKTNFLLRSEACVICSLDECLEEDDVFVYCDSCSILIHRKCLNINATDLKNNPWFCPNCKRSKNRKAKKRDLLDNIKGKEALDVMCGRKKKVDDRKRVSEVLSQIFDISEGPCIICGKEDSITLPVHNLPDHFAHVSCAKWIDSLVISEGYDRIMFANEHELNSRLNPFKQKFESWSYSNQFFSATLYPVDKGLSKVLESDNYVSDLKTLKITIRNAYKSSSPALMKDKNITLSTRLKRNNFLKQQNKFCQCLYHSLISVNFLFILRRILSKITLPPKDPQLFEKISKLLVELYPYIKGNYHRPRCPKGSCADCHFPPIHKCQICITSQGIVFKCSEDKCKRLLHVECARRVFCELVPKGLLSDQFLIFCPEHSKGAVFRRVETLHKKLLRKKLEICNILNGHHSKVLFAKKSLEKDGNFKFFEEIVWKEFEESKKSGSLGDKIEKKEDLVKEDNLKKREHFYENKPKIIKSKRKRKNKFLKLLQNREVILKNKLKKGVLNTDSYWFLKYKKIRPSRQKIFWNLKKINNNEYKIKCVSLNN